MGEVAVPTRVIGPAIKPSLRALAVTDPQVIWKVLLANSPLLHAVSPVGGRLAAFAARVPLITTIHDVIPFFLQGYSPLKYAFLKWCIWFSVKNSDAIIVPFEFTKKFLISRFAVDPSRIAVVTYGIDLSEFNPGSFRDFKERRILFLGGGFPIMRGGDLLLRAFGLACSDLDDAQLILSGTGPEEKMLRKLARDHGLAERVSFPGFIEESQLALEMRSVDLLVHPSRLGFSLSVVQGMASRTPVIVTDDLDSREAVGEGSIVCPSGDVSALAEAMVRILSDADLAKRVAQSGYERSKHFSTDAMAINTFKVYERAISRSKT